ncbi:alpha/beta fold hydrolase [Rhodovulum strictum]|uniref:Alpha/beta fold hydrolase n=1 Tax=Rhodovulum strictum TaxID=58314 RepID=A0A844BJ98_9RHOB|nr:alpha/beta hydrolase [Rhodovulum strictum]MRH21645.1 alpha/beta fold hydrolase [Rhodovulum strictum]
MTSGLPGFASEMIATNGIALSVHRAGRGAPLILLHGYPQNHMCWLNVAPALAERFHVIVPDLRGYGDSEAPPDDDAHTVYSKREMARDITGLMDSLGLPRAHLLGHDRGARVAYRLALDAPDRVDRLGIIEIVPTGDFWAVWNADLALGAYHWTFLAQPAPWPERMIGADPVGYVEHTLASWTLAKSLDVFPPAALTAYRRQAADPARIAAMCADYRAGATTDRRIDEADRAAGARIAAPLMFLWAETGFPARTGRPAAIWRAWAGDVRDAACRSGHFAMEENPQAVLDAFLPFFAAPARG